MRQKIAPPRNKVHNFTSRFIGLYQCGDGGANLPRVRSDLYRKVGKCVKIESGKCFLSTPFVFGSFGF